MTKILGSVRKGGLTVQVVKIGRLHAYCVKGRLYGERYMPVPKAKALATLRQLRRNPNLAEVL